MADRDIDDDRIAAFCEVLVDHGVEYVVIGGVAARLHHTGHATVDIDICPSTVEENLERRAEELTEDSRTSGNSGGQRGKSGLRIRR